MANRRQAVRTEKDEESQWLWSNCVINKNNCRYVFAQCSRSLRLPHRYKKTAKSIDHSHDCSYAHALEGSCDFFYGEIKRSGFYAELFEKEFRVERKKKILSKCVIQKLKNSSKSNIV